MQRSTSSRCCCGRHVPPLPWGAPQQSARARPSVRRASATPARASVDDARSETEGSSWPRRAQPDDAKSGGPGRSYDDAGVTASVDEAQLAKNRETFLLRLASLGFGAVLVGERITGRGVVQALGHPTGIPLYEMDAALGVLVGLLFIGGLTPTRFIYSSVSIKPKSPFDDVPALLGRLSCIGLGSTIAAEVVTGKGVLGLLNLETGTETLTEIEFAVVFLVLLLVTNWKSPPSNKSL